MEQIYKHVNDDGSEVRVYDMATIPVTFMLRNDRPGKSAVEVHVPESFFADVFNRINLGENFADLPGEYPAA